MAEESGPTLHFGKRATGADSIRPRLPQAQAVDTKVSNASTASTPIPKLPARQPQPAKPVEPREVVDDFDLHFGGDDDDYEGEASTEEEVVGDGESESRSTKRRSYRRLNDLDRLLLDFITRFKMAKVKHLADLSRSDRSTVSKRLTRLEEDGYVKRIGVPGGAVWLATSKGAMLTGLRLGVVSESVLRLSTFPHYWLGTHIAANINAGNLAVLDPSTVKPLHEVTPIRVGPWHMTPRGEVSRCITKGACKVAVHFASQQDGEAYKRERADRFFVKPLSAVSEYQIRTVLDRARKDPETRKVVHDVADLAALRQRRYDSWTNVLDMDPELSPELQVDNEHFWTVFYRDEIDAWHHHPPDLVIPKLPKVINGQRYARSIAVEVELNRKSDAEDFYPRILKAYDDAGDLYGQVYWVVSTEKLRKELTRYLDAPMLGANGEPLKDGNGNVKRVIENREKFHIIPVYLADGTALSDEDVLRNNKLWNI